MRIRITTTFTDKQATDPDKAEIAAGSEITATAERGAELVSLGLAVDAGVKADNPIPKRRTRKAKPTGASAAPGAPAPIVSSSASDAIVFDPPALSDVQ